MLHGIVGPQFILECFYFLSLCFCKLLLFAVAHYYIAALVYVVVVVLITWSVVRNTCCESREYQAVREEFIQLNSKVNDLDTKLNIILDKLDKQLESKANE